MALTCRDCGIELVRFTTDADKCVRFGAGPTTGISCCNCVRNGERRSEEWYTQTGCEQCKRRRADRPPAVVDLDAGEGHAHAQERFESSLASSAGAPAELVIRSDTAEGLPELLSDKLPRRSAAKIEASLAQLQVLRVRCPRLKELPVPLLRRLVALRAIVLEGCACLQELPAELGQLSGLHHIDLGGCACLQELPAELGQLSGLQRIHLEGCRALHTPPPHTVRLGTAAVIDYLRDLAATGSAPCHLVKVVLLGNERAGKSSLADSLVAGRPTTRAEDDRTVGIDVCRWWLGARGQGGQPGDPREQLVANIYDAAGHRVYRATHGLFMSDGALFLHVVRADAPKVAEAVLEWMEAVQQEAPGAVMGIVCTHVDLLHGGDEASARLQQAVLERVRDESERQVRAVEEVVRQAEVEFEEDAAWRDVQAQRNAALEALDAGLAAAWQQQRGEHRADSACIGRVAEAQARLDELHREMQELEARMMAPAGGERGTREEARARLQRLREQRVRRPRVLLSLGVSSKTGRGLGELRCALAALMKDQRLFRHVGMKVPRSYAMLERLAQEGRAQASQDGGKQRGAAAAAAVAAARAPWEDAVTAAVTVADRANPRLKTLCAQPHVALRELEQEAARVDMDSAQLHRSLQFLHATGSVLHYNCRANGGPPRPPAGSGSARRAQPRHAAWRAELVQQLGRRVRVDAGECWVNGWWGIAFVCWLYQYFMLQFLKLVSWASWASLATGSWNPLATGSWHPLWVFAVVWHFPGSHPAVHQFPWTVALFWIGSFWLSALDLGQYWPPAALFLGPLAQFAARTVRREVELWRLVRALSPPAADADAGAPPAAGAAGARQGSRKLQEVVFMQPHFVIDGIKYVIREPEAEDVNRELRERDRHIRGTSLQRDLEGLLERGEATQQLLTELWRHLTPRDRDLVLELMIEFKLLRELHAHGGAGGACKRYVVPAMLPNRGLPEAYAAPQWWNPARAAERAAVVRVEPAAAASASASASAAAAAAMRVTYEVVGGRLPFAFMTELQVSLVLQPSGGDRPENFSPEDPAAGSPGAASVVDRVAGSVLSESYTCGGGSVTEWVVVSQGATVLERQEADADSSAIRVMAWAELIPPAAQGAADWRLLRRVLREIEEAGRRMPATYLRKLVWYVDEQGRPADPEEVPDGALAPQFITFRFRSDGSKRHVEASAVLPQEGVATPLAVGVRAATRRAAGGAKNRVDAFFAKTVDDAGIDVHAEGQLITRAILHPGADGWECTTHPQPTLEDLRTSMGSADARNVKLVHLAGHSRREHGFLFNADDAATASAAPDIHALTDIISGAAGSIECAVLNACSTVRMGELLRAGGMPHIVCWRTPVHDETAREFCDHFYQALVEQSSGRNYRDAFTAATDAMRVHAFTGGAARPPSEASASVHLQPEHSGVDEHAPAAASLRESGGAAQQTRAKVLGPWQLEDAIQFLSAEGDSTAIYLWRERASRRSDGGGAGAAGGHTAADSPKRRRFVFFSCRIGTDIDPARESQTLKDRVFRHHADAVVFEHIPQPETSHFSDELERIGNEDVSLHFSGHGDANSGGLCWHGAAGRRQKEMQIRGKQLAKLIEIHGAADKIACFFLNACCTLATGLELQAVGVRVVVCWQTPVTDAAARDFATRFYELSFRAPGHYAKAFAQVCNEQSGALSDARPCLLQAISGHGDEQPGTNMWNGEEVVAIAEDLLRSPHFLQPTSSTLGGDAGHDDDRPPFASVGGGQMAADEDEDEDDVYKNWRPPNKDTDFAAHAGQAEKAALKRLNFNLRLNGREIGGSHGLDRKGFLTQEALQAIGIGNYARLWRTSGKVVEEARKMLRREKSSVAACEQVRLARSDLELSIFYRQLDIMAFRFKPQHTPRWYEHKAALLRRGKEDILNEYRRDCEDRERMRGGHALASARQQELASACNSHLYQLDMRYETMQQLQDLLLCQDC